MLTELNGKSGCVCESAKTGQIRCPLIIRPTSEDVITGNVFQVLGALNPRWWLPDLLNYGLGAPRFQRQNYRGLKIELWKSRGFFPRELLPWREGRTEVDVTISWENPATTVFLEMKYLSPLSKSSASGRALGEAESPSRHAPSAPRRRGSRSVIVLLRSL